MRKIEHHSFSHDDQLTRDRQVIDAYAAWIDNLIDQHFWQGWMVGFMFEELHLTEAATKTFMQREVIGFFKKIITRFHRKPNSAAAFRVLPRLIGCPDYPVLKHEKEGFRLSAPNSGLHYNAVFIHPLAAYTRACRLKIPVDEHVEENKSTYCSRQSRIDRIHVTRIDRNPGKVINYTLKALENGRIALDDILLLPQAISERKQN
jgi:hypothetical protein